MLWCVHMATLFCTNHQSKLLARVNNTCGNKLFSDGECDFNSNMSDGGGTKRVNKQFLNTS